MGNKEVSSERPFKREFHWSMMTSKCINMKVQAIVGANAAEGVTVNYTSLTLQVVLNSVFIVC